MSRALRHLIAFTALIAMPSAKAQTFRLLYSFQCGADGSNPYGGLVRDSAGNLYGTTFGGGSGYGVVFKLTPAGTLVVLHPFAGSPDDGATPVAAMVQDKAGNLYGTTGNGGVSDLGIVFKVAPNGTETVLYSFVGGNSDGGLPLSRLAPGYGRQPLRYHRHGRHLRRGDGLQD